MKKKIYVKPEAEHIVFYSEEEIANMNILNGSNEGGDSIGGGTVDTSGVHGVEKPEDW